MLAVGLLGILGVLLLVSGQGVQAGQPMPVRKSGVWEVTLGAAGAGPRVGQAVLQCTNAEAESVMLLSVVPGQENCAKPKVVRGADGAYTIRTVCHVHGNEVRAELVLRGDLQSAYRGTYVVKYPGAPQYDRSQQEFSGRWLGACKAWQRPGDMVLPNGVTVNVVDDHRRTEASEGHHHFK